MNPWIGLVELLTAFFALMVVYRLFGKQGMFAWIPVATVLANIQVVKTVELFGITATLGNVLYATTFTATDILSENHGRRDAAFGVAAGFIGMASTVVFMSIALWYEPAPSDFAHSSLAVIFSILPRVLVGSVFAYLLSQFHDIYAYEFWMRKFPHKKYIFIRNNASTFVSQLLDTGVFTTIAFWGTYETHVFLQIVASTYLFKIIVAAADTPLVYLAREWKDRRIIG